MTFKNFCKIYRSRNNRFPEKEINEVLYAVNEAEVSENLKNKYQVLLRAHEIFISKQSPFKTPKN